MLSRRKFKHATSTIDVDGEGSCHGRGDTNDEEFLHQCKACRLAGMDAPRVYIQQPNDGLGSRFQDVIAGMAIAAQKGMVLGGITFGKQSCKPAHGFDVVKIAGSFFGLKNMRLMFTNHPPKFERVATGVADLDKGIRKYGKPAPKTNIYLTNRCLACELDRHAKNMSDYFTPRLLNELRKATLLKREPLVFKKGVTSVAIHVRRGDITADNALRGTGDEWYYSIMSQLRKLIPDADIHVFSSLEGKGNSKAFDGYRKKGATVHLDGDILEPWAHFAMADVLVTAKSSFSHVPAFLNSNCVVYQPYWHRPLDGWVHTMENPKKPLGHEAQKALTACLVKIGKAPGLAGR